MKTLVLILLLIPSYLWAACTWVGNSGTAASGSTTEIANCISNASSMTGAVTITIPNGSVTHTSAVSVNMSSGFTNVTSLTIQGASRTGVVITNAQFSATVPAAKKYTLKTMTHTGAPSNSITGGTKPSAGGGFRFTDMTINSTSARVINISGSSYGLIDNILSSVNGQWSINNGNTSDGGNASWLADDTIGGADNVIIENIDATNTDSTPYIWFIMDQTSGARTVVRYSNLRNYHFGGHDTVIAGYRSNRHWEFYNNYITTNMSWGMQSMNMRGGTGFIYNNRTYASTSKTPYAPNAQMILRNRRTGQGGDGAPWSGACDSTAEKFCKTRSNGGKPNVCSTDADCGVTGACVQVDGNTDGTGWPCRGQLGRGKDDVYQPAIFWNNKTLYYDGTEAFLTPSIQAPTHIQNNRDFCNSNTTTMPATCNGVTTSYTAYTCPHPFTGSTGSCDSAAYGTAGYDVEGGAPDVTPPVVSGVLPTGQIAYIGTATLQATTNENATTKYSITDVTYANMATTFSTTGGLTHSTVVNVTENSSQLFYAASSDDSGNITYFQIAFTVATASDTTPPTISTRVLSADGRTLTLTADETVKYGAGSTGGVTVTPTGGAATASYISGNNSSTVVYYLSRAILSTETLTVTYVQPTNGWEDTTGNDLASFSTAAVTNNSTQSAASSGSIWPSDVTVGSASTGNAVEVGVKFTLASSVLITHVSFYKDATNTGTHVGRLWSGAGTLLGSITFTGESASGWQTMAFTTPIQCPAGDYVASVHMASGVWNSTVGYFTSPYTSAPFTATEGRYRYGSGGVFPTSTSSRNYWIDVASTTGAFAVTPSVTGTGHLSAGVQVVATGGTVQYTATPENGWKVGNWGGTCGGTGTTTYTTSAVTADCTVTHTFLEIMLFN